MVKSYGDEASIPDNLITEAFKYTLVHTRVQVCMIGDSTKKAKRLSAALTAAALAAVVLYAGPAVASDTGQSNSENNLVSEQAPQSESFSEEVASTVTNQDHGRNEITRLDELATSNDMEVQLGNSATAANPGLKSECPDPVFMTYYRTWRDVKMPHNANSDLPDPNVIAMTDLPYGVNIVSLFH